ncbi:L-aspartate oxidase [Halobacillus hunanensis]|uniref:L-aspartate oxidase n=1 Tax=Halobacillus hunanensis TaxID=578214 RepID=UPI0009A7C61C|nr:L-aspartate oxidase [Halobacillus hunanensis]
MRKADVIIVGSGIAALQLAVHISRRLHVIVLTKSKMQQSNSFLAQGGVAAAIGENDHPASHFQDTIEAGRNVNDHEAVWKLTAEAPGIIQDLAFNNCQFDYDREGSLHLGKEGAHSHARIIHGGGDQTGRRIVDGLLEKLGSNIQIYEDESVYELLVQEDGTCYGVSSKSKNGNMHNIVAPHVVLATGGCGQLFSFTSNAQEVTGDGVALAYWAGARIKDMEFVQFHPTLLFHNGKTRGLVSEAVRGAGARLVDECGNHLMEGIHPFLDLAPRHVVAQTIFNSIQKGCQIYLDVTSITNFEQRFPTAAGLCAQNDVQGRIPVAPGCHFLMGGVETDHVGRTNVSGLYAIGEVACTGVHGANRLASNSLLEGLVYGRRLARYLSEQDPSLFFPKTPSLPTPQSPVCLKLPSKEEIQRTMMSRVGIVRNRDSLKEQLSWIESFELNKWMTADFRQLTKTQWETVAMLQTSWLITTAALERTESRGGHYRSDFPNENKEWEKKHLSKTLEKRTAHESVQA